MGSEKKRRRTTQKMNDRQNTEGRTKEGDEGKFRTIIDDRFASAQSDPRFMEAPKKRSKVAIDSRFRRIFTDRGFANSNAPTDKRGKPHKNKKATTSLEHYYRLKQQEDEKEISQVEQEEEPGDDDAGGESETDEKLNGAQEEDDSSDDDDVQSLDESLSTSTEDSDELFSDDEEEDAFMLPVENIPEIEKETRRLALVNLDWGQVRAVDLYVLLSSFLPKGGQIFSVAVYPSEFGQKRIAEEAVHGPVGLFDEEEYDDDEGDDEIDNKKLRSYELSKLRYYFAVVECDSIATADYLYKTCDGVEFERSANKLDLRFIPDSMEFKNQPRDVAKEAPADYEGLDFQTRALQHSNVELTWDEDEPQRAKTLKRRLNDDQLADLELKEILASDESDSDDEKKADAYRALLQSGDGSDEEHGEDNDGDMEVTFNSGLEDISKRILEKKDKKSETVWEAYLKKRKEKRKASKNRSKHSSEDDSDGDTDQELEEQEDDFFDVEPVSLKSKDDAVERQKKSKSSRETTQEAEASRAELELLTADDKGPEMSLKGFNLRPKRGKGKKENGVPDVGKVPITELDDPRFSALFTSPLFALDPTDPQFKRSATYARQFAQKQKMSCLENEGRSDWSKVPDESPGHKNGGADESDAVPRRKDKNELSSLVKSIKLKSKHVISQSRSKLHRK